MTNAEWCLRAIVCLDPKLQLHVDKNVVSARYGLEDSETINYTCQLRYLADPGAMMSSLLFVDTPLVELLSANPNLTFSERLAMAVEATQDDAMLKLWDKLCAYRWKTSTCYDSAPVELPSSEEELRMLVAINNITEEQIATVKFVRSVVNLDKEDDKKYAYA